MCRQTRSLQSLTLPSPGATIQSEVQAEVAQLVEQLIRNQQVVGSSPTFGSIESITYRPPAKVACFVSTLCQQFPECCPVVLVLWDRAN